MIRQDVLSKALKFCEFVDRSPTPFHAVKEAKSILLSQGFREVCESKVGQEPGKFFIVRDGSSLISWVRPKTVSGLRLVGSHTDSPCLKLAPKAFKKGELNQLAVWTYGGGLWSTWMDRDLGVAGRILFREQGQICSKLFRSKKALCKIPHLAIHLRDKREDSIKEDSSLQPIFSCETFRKQLGQPQKQPSSEVEFALSPEILTLVCEQTGLTRQAVVSFDLQLFDFAEAGLLGLSSEFISSPRIDNLMSVYASVLAIAQVAPQDDLLNVCFCLDHEQVGSGSYKGADSSFVTDVLQRIVPDIQRLQKQSFFLSCDMAHALHPNYPVHDPNHKVGINGGVVIKTTPGRNYSTSFSSMELCKELARQLSVPFQIFTVRNESRCGTTIGPLASCKLGIDGVDIGTAMWGMHSCRETAGTLDLEHYTTFIKGFFSRFKQTFVEARD